MREFNFDTMDWNPNYRLIELKEINNDGLCPNEMYKGNIVNANTERLREGAILVGTTEGNFCCNFDRITFYEFRNGEMNNLHLNGMDYSINNKYLHTKLLRLQQDKTFLRNAILKSLNAPNKKHQTELPKKKVARVNKSIIKPKKHHRNYDER